MSPKTFRKVANDICRQGRILREDAVHQHFPDASQPVTAENVARSSRTIARSSSSRSTRSAALHPPTRLAPKVAKMLSTAKKALARVVSEPTLLLAGPDPFAAVGARASALGLKECTT